MRKKPKTQNDESELERMGGQQLRRLGSGRPSGTTTVVELAPPPSEGWRDVQPIWVGRDTVSRPNAGKKLPAGGKKKKSR